MSTEIRHRVREVFAAVCERPEGEQKRALEELCGGDERIRGEVESLLGFHRPDDAFLSASAMRDAGFGEGGDSQVAMTPGTKIGRYSIARLIGSGGMGVVYEGRQENPDRKVAIKLMRPGGASSAMVKRFAQEARALAILQHPGIAQIFDAGRELTAAGPIPYLVMELVEGITLGTFVQRHKLAIQARLKLVLQVCDAVAHAHHRGVIHRDLKPTNVLVDETGRARILDFGIARLADTDARATISTSGGAVLGTLAYMSPEQAGGDPTKIDTRADVYSLGVVLYETLTGKLPLDVSQVSISEAVRRIKEIDPTPPSTHVSECRGELDTITLKALSKDASRRYQSAEALGEDIRRYLTGRPILARGDSALYVLSKHVRRHRVPVTAAAILLIGLVTFSIYASIISAKERAARRHAEYSLALANEQQKRADEAAAQLEKELHLRSVESARLIAHGGNLAAAENLLWMEDAAWPGSLATKWGLRDLYRGFQILRTIPGSVQAQSMTMHTNSRWIAFTSASVLRIVDIRDGSEVFSMPISDTKTTWMDFSRDSRYLVHLGDRSHLTTYRVDESGKLSIAWEQTSSTADTAAYDIDYAAASVGVIGSGGQVRLLSLADGTALFEGHIPIEGESRLRCTRLTPDSRTLLAATQTALYAIELSGAGEVRKIASQTSGISYITCSPDGKQVITGSTDQFVRFYNIRTGELMDRLAPANGAVRSIEFSPDGKILGTLGWWRLDLWDAITHQRIGNSTDRPIGGTRMVFSPDSKTVVSNSEAGVRVWSTYKQPSSTVIHEHERFVGRMSLSGDGKRLASIDARGRAIIWDATTMRMLGDCGAPGKGWEIAESFSGDTIATMSESGTLDVYDGNTFSNRVHLETKTRIADIVLTKHDELIAVGTFKPDLQFRDVKTGEIVKSFPLGKADFYELEKSDDGKFIFTLQRNTINMCDVETMTLIPLPLAVTQPRAICPNSDGSILAIGLFSGGIEVWNINTRTRICSIAGHRETISRLALSPDGRVLASGAGDGINLWDANTGAPLMTLQEPAGGDATVPVPGSLQFIGNSKLVVGYSDGTLEVFDFEAMDRAAAANARKAIDVAASLGIDIPSSSVTDPAKIRKWLLKVNQALTSGDGN